MAIIYSYPSGGTALGADQLLITRSIEKEPKNYNLTMDSIVSYAIISRNIITGTGTLDTIPVFTSPTTIGDSVMTKVNGGLQITGGLTITDFLIADGGVRLLGSTPFSANILNVNGTTNLNGNANVSGAAFIEGNLTVEGKGVFDQDVTIEGDSDLNGSLNVQGTLTIRETSTFNADALFEEKAEFQGEVADSQGNVGTAGQVLTSTASGVQWATDGGGTVTGVGTAYTIPMWLGAFPTSNLADSTLTLRLVDPGEANPYSLRFGGGSDATGLRNSVAIGYNVQATNESTLATGFNTIASGVNAASFNFETRATGNKSAAFGSRSIASGTASFAIGLGNTAATSNSFAGGLNSTANPSLNGTSAFAYGNGLNVTGDDAAGFGKNNTVAGKRSFVTGTNNIITSGANTFALGVNNNVNGDFSGVLGSGNSVSSAKSYALGEGNTISNTVTNRMALGYQLNAGDKQYQVTVGYKNAVNNDANFVVGAGTTGLSKNGLEVYDDKVVIPEYGNGTVTGTAAYNLQVDAAGKIIETFVPAAPTYLSTVFLVSQASQSAPVNQNVLENSLGITFNWTYVSPGVYNLNAPGKFKLFKTAVFANNGNQTVLTDPITWVVVDTDNIKIRTGNTNNQLIKASIEIRTYN